MLTKMSSMCWRARRKALLANAVNQQFGILMVSKCYCCVEHKVETLNHVLWEGEEATKIWSYFAAICGVQTPSFQNWEGGMNFWWGRATSSS